MRSHLPPVAGARDAGDGKVEGYTCTSMSLCEMRQTCLRVFSFLSSGSRSESHSCLRVSGEQ